jgi:DNA sulfur modification protein DndD
VRFNRLTITDFGPYKGQHSLEFPSEGGGLVVVFGDNMRGKTSLLNALRWVLFGEALDRMKRPIDSILLLNKESLAKGINKCSVSVGLHVDDMSVEIVRQLEPIKGIAVPKTAKEVVSSVYLRKNGNVVDLADTQDEIGKILPKEVSRFCLFDGELLQEYEALLVDDSEQGKRIAESIEQVLGVPSLLRGSTHLQTLQRAARREQAIAAKQSEGLQGIGAKLANLEKESSLVQKEIEDELSKLAEVESQIEEDTKYLSSVDALSHMFSDLREQEDKQEALQNRIAEEKQALSEHLKEAWKDVLSPVALSISRRLEADISSSRSLLRLSGSVSSEIENIKILLESNSCPLCHGEVTGSSRVKLAERCAELEHRLQEISGDTTSLSDAEVKLRMLRDFSPRNSLIAIVSAEKKLSQYEVDLTRVSSRVRELKDQLHKEDEADISYRRKRLQGRCEHKGRLKLAIESLRKKKEGLDSDAEKLSKLMSKAPESRTKKANMEAEVYSDLSDCFGGAISGLRDSLRASVAQLATEAFMKLTTEPNYKSLSINKNYGLTIITQSGVPVSIRSAGAEQIVALSLVAGLNAVTSLDLPMVMDTPFGRLDPKHRQRVLRNISELAAQVILLVHPGEIDPITGLKDVHERVSAVYTIERESEFSSCLQRRK